MPLIKVQTSAPIAASETQVNDLLKTLSAKLAKHLSKPESYVMTSFEPQAKMTFAGTFDPVCYLEIKNIGTMSPAQTKTMSQDFCELIQMTLGVPQNRIYIEFNNASGSMWGWNGSTF
jgi:phenylpyruvate tautomerase PptA (4-oxalocrotonate tautomerase family)